MNLAQPEVGQVTGGELHGVSVRIENLSKSFGGVPAIAELSLHVVASEMLVLVGPSGCGKTTCLRCLAGLERPTSGRILIGDRVVTAIKDGIFVAPENRQIGMVFQSYAVWPHMTVFDNVAYPLRAMGTQRSAIKPRVEEALRLVQLAHLADRYSSQLSGGQQQRVALARSLVAESRLLLFDEPLSNLDANLRTQMRIEITDPRARSTIIRPMPSWPGSWAPPIYSRWSSRSARMVS
jgi:iron(III) transport system ATP-binding protein